MTGQAFLSFAATLAAGSLAVATVEPTRTRVRNAIIAYERNVLRQVTWSPPPP